MCVFEVTKTEILDKELIAFKLVRSSDVENIFYSQFSEGKRTPQSKNYFDKSDNSKEVYDEYFPYFQYWAGSTVLYKLGEKRVSSFETTPGIYCYESLEALRSMIGSAIDESNSILKVLIPKGTKIRRASSFILPKVGVHRIKDTILTEELIPIEVVKEAN